MQKTIENRRLHVIAFSLSAGVLLVAGIGAAAQTTSSAPRSPDAIKAEIEAAHQQFNSVMKDPADVSDPARRKAIAPRAIPPLKTMVNDFAELADRDPSVRLRASQLELQFNGFLAVLGDQPTIDYLRAQSQSKDPAESIRGQSSQLLAQWVLAGKDQTIQSKLTDQIQTLDQAHAENQDLTFLTFTLSQSTVSPELEQRLLKLAGQMQNPMAEKVRNAAAK